MAGTLQRCSQCGRGEDEAELSSRVVCQICREHGCQLRPDHSALADAVHGMFGRLLLLETRVKLLEDRTMPFDGSILKSLIAAIQAILGHVDGAALLDKLVPLITSFVPAQWQWLVPIIVGLLKQGIPAPTVEAIVEQHADDHAAMKVALAALEVSPGTEVA